MFIEVTRKPKGEFALINVDQIVSVSQTPGGGSQIVMRDNSVLLLTYESFNDIKKLINDKSRIK